MMGRPRSYHKEATMVVRGGLSCANNVEASCIWFLIEVAIVHTSIIPCLSNMQTLVSALFPFLLTALKWLLASETKHDLGKLTRFS